MYSVPQAATRLAVNPARIRALLAAGELTGRKIGGRWLVDRAGLENRARRGSTVSPGARRHVTADGRPFSERGAWAVLLGMDDAVCEGMSRQQRHRLKARLGRGAIDVAKLRRRATSMRYEVHRSMVPELLDDPRLVRTGSAAAVEYAADIVGSDRVDAYVPQDKHDAVIRDHGLVESRQPNAVLLRVVNGVWPFATGARVAPKSVVCVDLLDSDDPRERRAAADLGVDGFTSKFFEIAKRRGRWLVGRWSDGGFDEILPAALQRAIENGTDVRFAGRMLRPHDVEQVATSL